MCALLQHACAISGVLQVRTWTPTEGPFHGFLVTHNEAISIADYFTMRGADNAVYVATLCV